MSITLHNKYDFYEITAVFATATETHLEKQYLPVRTRFLFKCLLGPLLAINAYLSHWGPWLWPSTYWFFVFSVIFYYGGSYVYEALTTFAPDSLFVGEYRINGKDIAAIFVVSADKRDYTLQLMHGQGVVAKRRFPYAQYFTQEGKFMETLFTKHLSVFLKDEVK